MNCICIPKLICQVILILVVSTHASLAQMYLIKNINTLPCNSMGACNTSCQDASSFPKCLTKGNDKLYFFAKGASGSELWESNGITSGTKVLSTISSDYESLNHLTYCNGKLYFCGAFAAYGQELAMFDLTTKQTTILDLYQGTKGSYPNELTIVNNMVAFSADISIANSKKGRELVYHNGTGWFLKELRIDSLGSSPTNLTAIDNKLYFAADGNLDGWEKGTELWEDNASTTSIPKRKTDVFPGAGGSLPSGMTKVGTSLIYFSAFEPSKGRELCKLNLNNGIAELIDLYTGPVSSNPEELIMLDDRLFFSAQIHTAQYPNKGRELATYSNSALGIKDVMLGSGSSNPTSLLKIGRILYFVANGNMNGKSQGYELWKRGTDNLYNILVADINKGTPSSFPSELVAYKDSLFFIAYSTQQWKLWKTGGLSERYTSAKYAWDINGTAAGTGLVKTANLTVVGNTLYFTADDGVRGVELWKYVSPTLAQNARMEHDDNAIGNQQEERMNTNANWVVCPNPFGPKLVISALLETESCELRIFDSNGHLVYEMSNLTGNKELNTNNLPDGFYTLQCKEPSKITSFKLVKLGHQ
jgi:ELWxxDGT repeat protein